MTPVTRQSVPNGVKDFGRQSCGTAQGSISRELKAHQLVGVFKPDLDPVDPVLPALREAAESRTNVLRAPKHDSGRNTFFDGHFGKLSEVDTELFRIPVSILLDKPRRIVYRMVDECERASTENAEARGICESASALESAQP